MEYIRHWQRSYSLLISLFFTIQNAADVEMVSNRVLCPSRHTFKRIIWATDTDSYTAQLTRINQLYLQCAQLWIHRVDGQLWSYSANIVGQVGVRRFWQTIRNNVDKQTISFVSSIATANNKPTVDWFKLFSFRWWKADFLSLASHGHHSMESVSR